MQQNLLHVLLVSKQKGLHFAFVHLIQMYSWVLLCHNHASFYDGKIRKIFISFKESEGDKGSRKPEKRYTRYLLQFTCAEGNCVLLMAYLKVTS